MTARVEVILEATDRGAAAALDNLGRSAQRGGAQAEAGSRRGGRAMAAMGVLARTGAGAAVAAAGAIGIFGVQAVKSASDVQQAFGALDAVYGQNSAQVKQWAADAAEQVGLSKAAYADFSATLGASLKNAGIEDYTGSTRQLVTLGADLAAQFGGSTADAVAALGSMMRGETDPIERYGVAIKQTDVDARLAATGQDHLTGAARRQAEAQARVALVMEQTKDAQGAFSREADSAAGAQQRLAAHTENLKSTIGGALLPYVARLTGWLAATVSGSNAFGQGLRRVVAVIVTAARPVLATLVREAARMRASFVQAAGGSDNLQRAGRILWAIFKGLVGFIAGAAIRYIQAYSAAVRTGAAVVGAISRASIAARTSIANFAGAIRNVSSRALDGVANVLDRISGAAERALGWVRDLVSNVGSAAAGLVGLGRAAPGAPGSLSGGLARAAGAGLLRGPVASTAFTYHAAPVLVSVNLDYRGLRRLIRSEVVAVTRESRSVLA